MSSRSLGPFPIPAWKVLYQNQFQTTIPLPRVGQYKGLKEKVGIITGANTGLGLEAARHFLALGLSRLILAVRSKEKGQEAAKKMTAAYPSASVEAWVLDMDSYPSIQAFAQKCNEELPRLDFVILNAGVHPFKFEMSQSTSHEITIQVNYLSTMLLTILLLPVLKSKGKATGNPPVLSVVSSLNAYTCKLATQNHRPLLASFDDPKVQPWDAGERYGNSKLLGQVFLNKLVDKVNPSDVIINMPEPGMVKGTDLARKFEGVQRIVVRILFSIAGRPVDRAAATYVDAVAGHGQESHGSFLMNNKIAPLSYFIYSDDNAAVSEQLWQETLEELKFANVNEIIQTIGLRESAA